ncbi:hypothetical protein KKA89_01170 [Patescibacteria group bacterium]|nr:hypothetical protein [Patescibacteria group bacterium]
MTQKKYILTIFDEGSGHALVPFRFETITEDEEYKIFVYDPNHPEGGIHIITIKKGLAMWSWEYNLDQTTTWSGFLRNSIKLIPISVLYNNGKKFRLPGTSNTNEANVFLSGEANLLLVDSEGRMTGFKDNSFVEEIPNVELIFPMNFLPNEEPKKWQPSFYIADDTDLKFVVEKNDNNKEFSLIKFGNGYFTELKASTGVEDSEIDISQDGANVSISGQQDKYSLFLNKNVEGESQTFNATNIQTTDSAIHEYAVDWDKLDKHEKGVEVKVDEEGDGVFEKTIISDNELTEEEFTASVAQQSNSSGGSGVIHNAPLPTTINSINYPMLLAASQEGTLTYNFKQATVKLSAPKEAVKDQTTFNISISAINANQKLDNTTGAFIIGDKVFNINAKDIKNNVVNNFNKDLTITITLPEMPADVSSLGVYWFNNSDSQWVLVPGATFDSVNNTAIFSVNHLTAFAVINGNGQTTIGLSEEPEIEIIKEVLGKQKYGNGVLLRSQNKRIYVVKNGMLNYISSLEELAKYSGQEILDVSDEDINAYSQEPQDSEKQVLGARKYSDGTLLRGLNMKIYVVSGGKLKYIASLEELSKYAGQDIINVDDEIIVNFGKSEVLGEQQYSNGTLLRGLDKKIYVVADKKLKHIIDLQELAKYAGQDIIDVSDDVIDSF